MAKQKAKAKQKQVYKQKPVDNTIYKAMADMGIVCVLLFLLQYAEKCYYYPPLWGKLSPILPYLMAVSAVLAVAGVVLALLARGKKLLRGVGITATLTFAYLAGGCYMMFNHWASAMSILYFVAIAGGCLYLIWILYPHDFFLISLLSTLSGAAFYLHGQQGDTSTKMIIAYCGLIALSILALGLTVLAGKNGGLLRWGKKHFRLFVGKQGAMPLYLACSINLACLAACIFLGSIFAYYCVFAAVGGLFVAACYYTMGLN